MLRHLALACGTAELGFVSVDAGGTCGRRYRVPCKVDGDWPCPLVGKGLWTACDVPGVVVIGVGLGGIAGLGTACSAERLQAGLMIGIAEDPRGCWGA
jgi:hypothetical protein